MKEWTEVIRDGNIFNLLTQTTLLMEETEISFEVGSRNGPIIVQYEEIRVVHPTPKGMINPPTHIAVSDVQSHASTDSTKDNIKPHAEDPAPAQRAGSIAFIWAPNAQQVTNEYLHRDDGFPAVVVAVNLSKHYNHGQLHRKGQHPAIKAEYLAALWYDRPGINYRGTGPSCIAFDNYKEFWTEGVYKGQRWTDYNISWKHRILSARDDEDTLGNFLNSLKGTTNMFTNTFFADAEDEVCYMADFA